MWRRYVVFFPSGIWPIFGCFFQQRSILSHTETYHIKAEPLPWKVQTAVVLPLADSWISILRDKPGSNAGRWHRQVDGKGKKQVLLYIVGFFKSSLKNLGFFGLHVRREKCTKKLWPEESLQLWAWDLFQAVKSGTVELSPNDPCKAQKTIFVWLALWPLKRRKQTEHNWNASSTCYNVTNRSSCLQLYEIVFSVPCIQPYAEFGASCRGQQGIALLVLVTTKPKQRVCGTSVIETCCHHARCISCMNYPIALSEACPSFAEWHVPIQILDYIINHDRTWSLFNFNDEQACFAGTIASRPLGTMFWDTLHHIVERLDDSRSTCSTCGRTLTRLSMNQKLQDAFTVSPRT